MKFAMMPLMLMLAAAPALAGADGDPAALYERGAYRRAAAVASQRDDAEALAVLARVRALEGRFDEAIAAAERAVKAAPGSASAHYALSEAHGLAARSAGALKSLGAARAFKREADAALAIDPNHVESLIALLEFHRMAPGIVGGDKKKRPALLDRLVAADPVRGWGMRAQDALRDKDTTRAEQYWRKAVEADPASARAKVTLASAHWRLALALEQQARKPEAIAELQTAVKLDPKFEPARKDLKRLKG